jgi:hypothetical protein
MADHIRYDLQTQKALRGVVRNVLIDAAKKGLPGDHHFYITFDTQAPGVQISQRLRHQYPDEMTIILQHQFWDLGVNEDGFEIGLSFGGIAERLSIPFDAIKSFFDPSVQFGLQFEDVVDSLETESSGPQPNNKNAEQPETARAKVGRPSSRPASNPGPAAADSAPTLAAPNPPATGPDEPTGGAEVVRLDRFRKK